MQTRALYFCASLGLCVVNAGCSRSSSNPSNVVAPRVQVKANPPLTKTQVLGVDLSKNLSRDPRLRQARISVGTSASTITLDGNVPNASSKKIAMEQVQKVAPGYKIINRLAVTPQSQDVGTSPINAPSGKR